MKIYAIHDRGGCGYYRIKLPMWQAMRHGHEVKLMHGADVDDKEQYNMAQWPVIVGQRVDKPDAVPIWRRFRPRSKLVYEIDDDVFNIEPVNFQAYRTYSKPETRYTVERCIEASNLVTVTTPYLAGIVRELNDNVAVLPNYVPEWMCDMPNRREGLSVGWTGGASHAMDMAEVANSVRRFLDRFPAWEARLIGTDFRETIKHEHVTYTPWIAATDDARAYYETLDFDIGIAPLDPASQFNRSKSHIKALEYAARGIPIVASDMEPYHDFVIHGETGFLVRRPHEWLKYMSALAADEDLRRSMGERARALARGWTIEGHWEKWIDAYERLM